MSPDITRRPKRFEVCDLEYNTRLAGDKAVVRSSWSTPNLGRLPAPTGKGLCFLPLK